MVEPVSHNRGEGDPSAGDSPPHPQSAPGEGYDPNTDGSAREIRDRERATFNGGAGEITVDEARAILSYIESRSCGELRCSRETLRTLVEQGLVRPAEGGGISKEEIAAQQERKERVGEIDKEIKEIQRQRTKRDSFRTSWRNHVSHYPEQFSFKRCLGILWEKTGARIERPLYERWLQKRKDEIKALRETQQELREQIREFQERAYKEVPGHQIGDRRYAITDEGRRFLGELLVHCSRERCSLEQFSCETAAKERSVALKAESIETLLRNTGSIHQAIAAAGGEGAVLISSQEFAENEAVLRKLGVTKSDHIKVMSAFFNPPNAEEVSAVLNELTTNFRMPLNDQTRLKALLIARGRGEVLDIREFKEMGEAFSAIVGVKGKDERKILEDDYRDYISALLTREVKGNGREASCEAVAKCYKSILEIMRDSRYAFVESRELYLAAGIIMQGLSKRGYIEPAGGAVSDGKKKIVQKTIERFAVAESLMNRRGMAWGNTAREDIYPEAAALIFRPGGLQANVLDLSKCLKKTEEIFKNLSIRYDKTTVALVMLAGREFWRQESGDHARWWHPEFTEWLLLDHAHFELKDRPHKKPDRTPKKAGSHQLTARALASQASGPGHPDTFYDHSLGNTIAELDLLDIF